MAKVGELSQTTIKFNRIKPGLYRSSAYDGHDRMKHSYEIENKSPTGWHLSVDGEWYGGYGWLASAKLAATRIERKTCLHPVRKGGAS